MPNVLAIMYGIHRYLYLAQSWYRDSQKERCGNFIASELKADLDKDSSSTEMMAYLNKDS
jgi:hypothetical protein